MPYYSTYYRKLLGKDSPSGRPLFSKRRTVRKIKPSIKTSVKTFKPTIKVKKPKIPSKKVKVEKKAPLRKAKVGLSRMRKSQLMLKPVDIYEKQMAQRIQRKSGMTYVQTMHLIRKARDYDIDIEHVIDWNLSKDKQETYELASKQLEKELLGHKLYREKKMWQDPEYMEDILQGRGRGPTMRDIGYEMAMYGY